MLTTSLVPISFRTGAIYGLILWLIGTPVTTLAVDVRVVHWDGSVLTGSWDGSSVNRELTVRTAKGPEVHLLDEIRTVSFSHPPRAPFGPTAFHLHDGGVMFGNLLAGEDDAVQARTVVGESRIPWASLAGIRIAEPTQFHRAHQLFGEALQARSPSQDVLISRDVVDVKVLQGRLDRLDQDGGTFIFAGEPRRFQLEKVFGIVFAAGASAKKESDAFIELSDGSSFSASIATANQTHLEVAGAFAGSITVPLTNVRRLQFRTDRVAFVGQLKPTQEQNEGYLHSTWSARSDRNVLGGPISMAGFQYERGLGTHSKSELTYSINGEFERFAAIIGLDDCVRPLGSVVMKVVGDDRKLFDSGEMTGADAPREILLDIKGVRKLTLVVDVGDGLDASDHANWADARLMKAFTKEPSSR